MAAPDVTVEVRTGDCPCPGQPHSVEQIVVAGELDLPTAAGAIAVLRGASDDHAAMQAALIRAYLPAVIRRWSFLEPDGTGGIRPVPVTRPNLERLVPWDKGGLEIVDRVDDLYSGRLLAPLVERTSTPSLPGPTSDSTSPTPASGSSPLAPSEPSSPTDSDGQPSEAPVQ